MAVKYWIKNSTTAQSADVDANWNTAADASGSAGKPGAGDTVVFGAGNSDGKGFAPCDYDITTDLAEIVILDGYKNNASVVSSEVEYKNAGSNGIIIISDGTFADDFFAGMGITVSGSVANDADYTVHAVDNNQITLTANVSAATTSSGT